MQHSRSRHALRGGLTALALVLLAACGQGDDDSSSPPSGESKSPSAAAKESSGEFTALERKFGARLGVYAIDTGSGREVSHNGDKRFSYNSTFKALAAGAVLRKHSDSEMDRVVTYSKDDLIEHSPVTEKNVDKGMTLDELCDAAVRYSDNAATNLLFDALGGPKALDATLAELGDDATRMERREQALSGWVPGEKRDTSTPRAMAENLRTFALGDALNKADRKRLTTWMRTNTTGDTLIKAGVPKSWKVGDKSGQGQYYGARGDIAVVWPPDSDPIVMAVLSHRKEKDDEPKDELIAEAASVAVDGLT